MNKYWHISLVATLPNGDQKFIDCVSSTLGDGFLDLAAICKGAQAEIPGSKINTISWQELNSGQYFSLKEYYKTEHAKTIGSLSD